MFSKLSNMTPKQLKRWELIRKRGKRHFVLYRGILGWGLWMFIVMTIFGHLNQVDFQLSFLETISIPMVITNLIVWTIAGYVFGQWTWSASEKTYLKNTGVEL